MQVVLTPRIVIEVPVCCGAIRCDGEMIESCELPSREDSNDTASPSRKTFLNRTSSLPLPRRVSISISLERLLSESRLSPRPAAEQ